MAAEVAVMATKHDPRAGKHAVYTVGVRDLLYRDAHLSLTIAATVLTGSAYGLGGPPPTSGAAQSYCIIT